LLCPVCRAVALDRSARFEHREQPRRNRRHLCGFAIGCDRLLRASQQTVQKSGIQPPRFKIFVVQNAAKQRKIRLDPADEIFVQGAG
jgi:hypothetical protein